jgi:hypothetical protein
MIMAAVFKMGAEAVQILPVPLDHSVLYMMVKNIKLPSN